jgi:hypothetical protein
MMIDDEEQERPDGISNADLLEKHENRERGVFHDLVNDARLLRGKVWVASQLCLHDYDARDAAERLHRALLRFERYCLMFARRFW